MSTDAWIEEHWIGEAVLPRPRRAPKLPALPVPHAPTCSRGNAALAAHAQSRDSARHPGDRLSARQDGRNVVDQQARKLTQPHCFGLSPAPPPVRGLALAGGDTDVVLYNAAMRPVGKLMDTKPGTFENTWRVSSFGAFLAAQQVVPAMLAKR